MLAILILTPYLRIGGVSEGGNPHLDPFLRTEDGRVTPEGASALFSATEGGSPSGNPHWDPVFEDWVHAFCK